MRSMSNFRMWRYCIERGFVDRWRPSNVANESEGEEKGFDNKPSLMFIQAVEWSKAMKYL